ncbi:uncharacterized protein NPIL_300261 [Nephila pilipes]|uniref:Spider venom protein n=1 Tax=Nephila pilipes TaxID=299642 RepID=A0A8X6P9C8_NEPPI|nr:uncharacterized protein NPIL_300261 [Nephila pilipes]
MATKLIIFVLIIFVFNNVFSTAADIEQNISSEDSTISTSNSSGVRVLLEQLGYKLVPRRTKRSPQWHQSLLVQGLSQPFCNLFGGNTGCQQYPTTTNTRTTPTQCAMGYRYDYTAQRCRQMQYRK